MTARSRSASRRATRVEVPIDDGPAVAIGPDDVELARAVLEGWGVASDGGLTVALELEISPALRREGLARELVRIAQDARKAAGLDVGDRIVLGIDVDGELAAARDEHAGFIAGETLGHGAAGRSDRPVRRIRPPSTSTGTRSW